MKIRLKNKRIVYFSKKLGIAAACMLLIVISLVIVGASMKKVTIVDNMTEKEVITYKNTVQDVLEQNKIELNQKDKVLPGTDSVVTDGMKIFIRRAVPVRVTIDGKDMQVLTSEETIGDMLSAEGITYDEKDKVYPEVDTAITKDLNIRIVRVTEEYITETEVLEYANETQYKSDWEIGTEKLVQNGSNGEKKITIKITYEDGVEAGRQVVKEEVTKRPINRVVAVGSKDWRQVSSRGDRIQFRKVLTMRATCYTNDIANTGKEGGRTATGTVPRRNSDGSKWSTVAVDPNVIPLGSKLWIEGYGYAIAEDVGGAVKGNKIDLFFEKGSAEYRNWGNKYLKVYILK